MCNLSRTSPPRPLGRCQDHPALDEQRPCFCQTHSLQLHRPDPSHTNLLVAVCGLAVVANNLHSSDHGANGEKAKNFCAYNAELGKLLSVDVADGVERGNGIVGADAVDERGRLAEGVGHGCEVGLELCDRGRSHLLALDGELGELETDATVVDGRWY